MAKVAEQLALLPRPVAEYSVQGLTPKKQLSSLLDRWTGVAQ